MRPQGYTVSQSGITLESRNLFRSSLSEVPRAEITDLWLDLHPNKATIYVECKAASAESAALGIALPLYVANWEEAKGIAEEVAQLLQLPWRVVTLVPVATTVAEVSRITRNVYRLTRVAKQAQDEGQVSDLLRDLAQRTRDILRFRSLVFPEVWIFEPQQQQVIHQMSSDTGRSTAYALADIQGLEIEPEKEGEKRESDDSTEYLYAYRMMLALTSGEKFLLKQYDSAESKKTTMSQASQDAEWAVQTLSAWMGVG